MLFAATYPYARTILVRAFIGCNNFAHVDEELIENCIPREEKVYAQVVYQSIDRQYGTLCSVCLSPVFCHDSYEERLPIWRGPDEAGWLRIGIRHGTLPIHENCTAVYHTFQQINWPLTSEFACDVFERALYHLRKLSKSNRAPDPNRRLQVRLRFDPRENIGPELPKSWGGLVGQHEPSQPTP